MISRMKNWLVGWLVKEQLGGLLSQLNGYKTLLGIVYLALQVAAHFLAGHGGAEVVGLILDTLAKAGTLTILGPEEVNVLAAALLTVWGALHKVVKKLRAPKSPEIVHW